MTDHYEVLGVARDASQDEIKQAYRRASAAAHPDREGGSNERQQQVNAAYEVLGDPEKRKAYDAGESTGPDQKRLRAMANLVDIFADIMENDQPGPVRDRILERLRTGDRNGRDAIVQLRRAANLADRWAKALKLRPGKEGADLFAGHAAQRAEGLRAQIKEMEEELEVCALSIELMDNYEDGIQPSFQDMYNTAMSGGPSLTHEVLREAHRSLLGYGFTQL